VPKATVNLETVHKELKSLPGGFVDLRRLPFGGMLKRRDMSGRAFIKAQENGQDVADEYAMEILQEGARAYEFKHCIIDHNLEDDNGRKLDFSKKEDVFQLDPKIGQEIEGYIDELNRELSEDEERNFPEPSIESSKVEETTPQG